MDFFSAFRRQVVRYTVLFLLLQGLAVVGIFWYTQEMLMLSGNTAYLFALAVLVFTTALISFLQTRVATAPVSKLWQAVQHVAPEGEPIAAPNVTTLRVGRELVSTMVNHIYQFANIADTVEKSNTEKVQDLHTNFVANSLPLPLLVLDSADIIQYLNEAALKYFGVSSSDIKGKNIYTALNMSFADDQTLHTWLSSARETSVTANHSWERVRVGLPGQKDSKQFDLAAHYNKDNSMGHETMLVLFDHTEVYSQDDQAMSFVALTVHELRTPLTLLRGYIEVFDEELGPSLNTEMQGFMKKMDASAQQLAAFVDNILNVAKIEDNQLTLQLHEEKWDDIINTVVHDLGLRAAVRGITIKSTVPADLPTVGVDRYSIYEVLANLLDNAIKYAKGTKEVHLTVSLNSDGMVETNIKDFGLGIDGSILPHIFDKFYRNHRNRAQIGGTGLGLYLSRSIVDAHGGHIWVKSKVDEGSTFSFTVLPFAKLAESGKTSDTSSITRNTHGWIKNHSFYRD
ncbi:MAG: ATP-binding protein [Candidatus Saccharimonadales bacterium]